jgi:hypothetical protein
MTVLEVNGRGGFRLVQFNSRAGLDTKISRVLKRMMGNSLESSSAQLSEN